MITPITHYALKKMGKKGFNDLSEEDQDKVKTVLFLLNKLCIGDAAYHNLKMCSGGEDFPRSYLIKHCKDDLNTLCRITRTPGVVKGAQLDFATELKSFLKKQINQNKIDIDDLGLTFRIKISEDGAKMTKLTIFIVISCSVFNNDEDPMSSKGNKFCIGLED
ncbi:uncharacterized protein LOC114959781 isoform X2 [Acropora millepora]|uniref:uncharacterized protein LOC114959781 isoform X2 n=1 Tax=Acropora millepora TaxID=45264 RepID=UPI001CF3709E|nr:uncharacterized protein LOC114959781 isoform X2 [Acropora millepora]